MKLSLNWLSSYFKTSPDWDVILDKLTMAGLELEQIIEDIGTWDEHETRRGGNKVAEFKITPNRGDCLSVTGMLREIQALTNYTVNLPIFDFTFKSDTSDKIEVIVNEARACPSYVAVTVKNIKNQIKVDLVKQFKQEVTDRLTASGLRAISPVVDITNYVMLELGQPLHAFDLTKVGNKLQVRFAKDGEELKLLDDTEVKLQDDTLVICDANNNVAAIAGVMGGKDSSVTELTTDIVIESAFFIPDVVSGKAKQYGVSSDSAYRFERGVDYQLQLRAAQYAATLIKEYCGGQIGEPVIIHKDLSGTTVSVSYNDITRLIGKMISHDEINSILNVLGFEFVTKNDRCLELKVPSFRFDIKIKEDIVEEVARVYGYDNITPILPIVAHTMNMLDNVVLRSTTLKNRLVDLGYSEIVSYAFIEDKYEELFGYPGKDPVKLKNPIAGLNVMRTSLIADLLKAQDTNINRGHERVRVFELGRVFHGEDEKSQPLKLSGLICGTHLSQNPLEILREVDFYDLSHDVKTLLTGFGPVKFVPYNDYPVLHCGRCAKIYLSGQEVGIIGQLHPSYVAQVAKLPYVFELDLAKITNSEIDLAISDVSKFQKVKRDLAFIAPDSLYVGDVLDTVSAANIPYLQTSYVFDIYTGDKLAVNVKSVAFGFLFQASDKTLTDSDINSSIEIITKLITDKFNVQLRT